MSKALLTAAALAAGVNAICGGTLNGATYDFSEMQKTDENNYEESVKGASVQWDFCKPISNERKKDMECSETNNKEVAIVRLGTKCHSFGVDGSQQLRAWNGKDGDKGVSLTWHDVDTTGSKTVCTPTVGGATKDYSFTVNLKCDPTATTPASWVITDKQSPDNCTYSVNMNSAYACEGVTPAPTPPTAPPTTAPPTNKPVVNRWFSLQSEGGKQLIKEGVVKELYTETKTSTTFLPYLENATFTQMPIMVANIEATPEGSPFWVEDSFDPQRGHYAELNTHIGGANGLFYDVIYHCDETENAKYAFYNITVLFSFPGMNYDNITYTWQKHCLGSAQPTNGDDGGMSKTGTFFLVVFIMASVGCVFGCGYNYVKMGKTGADIIPCVGCLRGSGSNSGYSAQEDQYTANTSDDAYGSTYHSDI